MRSRGMTWRASSRRPGFSYLVGVRERESKRFRNFCDCASAGGDGMRGRFRNDEYDGNAEPLDVLGRGDGDADEDGLLEDDACDDADARRLDDDVCSRG